MSVILEDFKRSKLLEPEPKPKPPWKTRDMGFQNCHYCWNAFLPAEFCGCGQVLPHCHPCHVLMVKKGMLSK